MHPILFRLGPVTITSYGVMLALACVLVAYLAPRAASSAPRGLFALSAADVVDWIGWAMLGGLLGGRLVYVALNLELYQAAPWTVVALWEGGLVWYGGFFGGLLSSVWFFRRRGAGWLRASDQLIPFVALGHALGRLGCFFNGCCLGTSTDAWFGVWFPGHDHAVVPTPLLESLGLLALFVGLRRLHRPLVLARPGTVLAAYLLGYGALRWTIEWWRDNPAFAGTGWTFSQWISAGLVAAGAMIVWRGSGDERRTALHR